MTQCLVDIGEKLGADVVTIISPIVPGLEHRLRQAIETLPEHTQAVAIILDTPGGVAEVVERMVVVVRFMYQEVIVIVPDRAMSSGIILALSADKIMMDHFSCLGPIDPQIEREGQLVPALSYLNQFERLNDKAKNGELSTAEYALLVKLDLGELHQFEQARELSIDLLKKWLTQYKFKNWTRTETDKKEVTESMKMKEERAREIAELLNDPEKWHSHGRGIDAATLRDTVGLKIDSLEEDDGLYRAIREYFELLCDYAYKNNSMSFVHTREYF